MKPGHIFYLYIRKLHVIPRRFSLKNNKTTRTGYVAHASEGRSICHFMTFRVSVAQLPDNHQLLNHYITWCIGGYIIWKVSNRGGLAMSIMCLNQRLALLIANHCFGSRAARVKKYFDVFGLPCLAVWLTWRTKQADSTVTRNIVIALLSSKQSQSFALLMLFNPIHVNDIMAPRHYGAA